MLKDILIQNGLSNREAEVAELVTKGLSNREVANQLFVTEKTVKFHLTNIYKKMSVKSRAQLIVWCLPHMEFVEREVSPTQPEPTNTASTSTTVGTTENTIPAGNSTVVPSVSHIPNPPGGGLGEATQATMEILVVNHLKFLVLGV